MEDEKLVEDEIVHSEEINEGDELNQTTIYPSFSSDEIKSILSDIEIKRNDDEDEDALDDKPKKSRKSKTSLQSDSNVQLTDDEITKKLYLEFNQFLEDEQGICESKENKIVIPTRIKLLDTILGGGIAVGALSIITGSPGSFKSTLAGQIIASAQKMFKRDFLASYMDSEEATTSIRLSNLGVNSPKIKPKTNITVEKVFQLLEALAVFKSEKKIIETPSVIIWDSIANTLSKKEMEAENPNDVIGYKARILSLLIPKYVAKCAEYNIAFIAVNQLRDVIDMNPFAKSKRELKFMSSNKTMTGGHILRYNAFMLAEMNLKEVFDVDKYGFNGVSVTFKAVKNKLFAPNINIQLIADFNSGFSDFWTSLFFLVETKRIKTGGWSHLINLPNKKFRYITVKELYLKDNEFKEAFDSLVDEAIKTDIIDKYSYIESESL